MFGVEDTPAGKWKLGIDVGTMNISDVMFMPF
jgi:hypothetical protein